MRVSSNFEIQFKVVSLLLKNIITTIELLSTFIIIIFCLVKLIVPHLKECICICIYCRYGVFHGLQPM